MGPPRWAAVAQPEMARGWARRFAGLFAADTLVVAHALVRDGQSGVGLVDGGPLTVVPVRSELAGMPVVCLIGPGTYGLGAELAMMLRALPNATLVGAPTRGSAELCEVILPVGMPVRFPGRVWELPDGCRLDSGGEIPPDVFVRPAPGVDLVLEQGLRTLDGMIAARGR